MNLSFGAVLQILALVAFILAAIGWTYRKIDLVAVGLALWSLSSMVFRVSLVFEGFPERWPGAVALVLAFLSFVAAATGWRYRRVNLIAAGLALWIVSAIVP
jgi:hypothetical protein